MLQAVRVRQQAHRTPASPAPAAMPSARCRPLALLAALLLLACAPRCSGDASTAAAATGAGSEACAALGFTGLALCSDCDELLAIVHDEGACCARATRGASAAPEP
jgi:hypothetical protein